MLPTKSYTRRFRPMTHERSMFVSTYLTAYVYLNWNLSASSYFVLTSKQLRKQNSLATKSLSNAQMRIERKMIFMLEYLKVFHNQHENGSNVNFTAVKTTDRIKRFRQEWIIEFVYERKSLWSDRSKFLWSSDVQPAAFKSIQVFLVEKSMVFIKIFWIIKIIFVD